MILPSKLICAGVGAIVAAAAGLAGAAQARPLTPAEQRVHGYSSNLPLCQDPAVLDRIASRLHQREKAYWSSGLQIVSYDSIRERGFRTTGLDYIPRRYCNASALMSDGKARHVTYWIGEDLGVIGWGWGVEWCIVGLDRNYAWGAGCKAAGP
ncbi:MAG TPA: hypothetical protein VIL72_05505 [Beijerinckiaceae bacterium]